MSAVLSILFLILAVLTIAGFEIRQKKMIQILTEIRDEIREKDLPL